MKSSKARSLRRATSSSPRSMCRRMSNASLRLAPSCSFRSGGNAWHTLSKAAPIIFSACGSYTYFTSLNEGISSSLFAPMQAGPALPLRAGRKSAAPFPLHFRKFVKIVSPASRENPNFGTEFPGWNGRVAVVECRACARSVASKPEFGRGSYDQSIWLFLCKACESCAVDNGGAGSFSDIRSTSNSTNRCVAMN